MGLIVMPNTLFMLCLLRHPRAKASQKNALLTQKRQDHFRDLALIYIAIRDVQTL